jgi:hypothetical protein
MRGDEADKDVSPSSLCAGLSVQYLQGTSEGTDRRGEVAASRVPTASSPSMLPGGPRVPDRRGCGQGKPMTS